MWFSAKPNSPNSNPKRSRSRNAWIQVSMWLFFRKFRYLLCVGNIMVTQLLRVSSVIFLELPLLTTFIILYFSCRIRKGAGECLPHATKRKYGLFGEKRDATFHLRVFHFVSDHAVFSVAVNKIQNMGERIGRNNKSMPLQIIFINLLST